MLIFMANKKIILLYIDLNVKCVLYYYRNKIEEEGKKNEKKSKRFYFN